jgi:RNA-directed DNA polymerase
VGTCRSDAKGDIQVGRPHKGKSTDAEHRGGVIRSSVEATVMDVEQRGYIIQLILKTNQNNWKESMEKTKSFNIPKSLVWNAFKLVKANKGAAGVDGESIAIFEKNLKSNLYKLWNRLSSGSYFPAPVKRVEIPKADGKMRPLGIPTVTDRIAQMAIRLKFEPEVEPYFDKDSYGYRPKKSALDAVGKVRERCWKSDWVLDVDIQGFFDNIDHELLMRAVRKHTTCRWTILYVERWLKAAVQYPDGCIENTSKGTPQGGVISPLLANLFLHYALDRWVRNKFPDVKFARYADDAVYHCKSRYSAEQLQKSIENRLEECKLKLHPEKTKIVYCKDKDRKHNYQHFMFDFLGYTFRPRLVRSWRGNYFVGFTPAMSKKARKSVSQKIKGWKMHLWSAKTLESIAYALNPVIRGWINYYGKYRRSILYSIQDQLDYALVRWAKRKYKKLKPSLKKATSWLSRIKQKQPRLFAHWALL